MHRLAVIPILNISAEHRGDAGRDDHPWRIAASLGRPEEGGR